MKQGNNERAAQLFEQALQLDDRNIPTYISYAQLLMKQGNNERAEQLLEQALKLDDRNLSLYAQVLAKQGKHQQVCELLDQIIENESTHSFTRGTHSYSSFKLAQNLEAEGRYQQALDQLLKIDLSQQRSHDANVIRLNLGRLYYLLGQPKIGKGYFTTAIELADDPDATRLYAARSLLAANSRSEEAIEMLLDVPETSLRYTEAMKTIALNAEAETTFELFGVDEEQINDIEMLYRAMYHKIGNEIAVLRSIAYRLLKRMENKHPIVKEVVNNLEKLQQDISRQRIHEKEALAGISHNNFKQLIEIISKTAHDISDEVNNQLAVIESKTRRAMRQLLIEDSEYQQFEKLLSQLKITQSALNDLKSINEAKIIRRDEFLVDQLFEKWEPKNWTEQPRIDGVRVHLDIRNFDSKFNGDKEKIKSILNELVENSLKHNQGNSNLLIRMYSDDVLNPSDVGSPTIPGDRKFLYIQFTDNGQGVPNDKKDWIFQPLKTTSPEDKGSGLGLFIVRKTIKKMGGHIREVGEVGQGVTFQIYLPYLSSSTC